MRTSRLLLLAVAGAASMATSPANRSLEAAEEGSATGVGATHASLPVLTGPATWDGTVSMRAEPPEGWIGYGNATAELTADGAGAYLVQVELLDGDDAVLASAELDLDTPNADFTWGVNAEGTPWAADYHLRLTQVGGTSLVEMDVAVSLQTAVGDASGTFPVEIDVVEGWTPAADTADTGDTSDTGDTADTAE